MYTTNLLYGQRILVTGGGTGLGQAMAEHFLSLGADIAICGRRKAVCDETAANALASGGNFYELRHWSDADWQEARQRIEAQNTRDKAQR